LIENAVKHGIAQVRGQGRIDVAARVADGRLHVTVSDTGPGPDADDAGADGRPTGESFGLRSVRERLRGHFGDDATFSLERDSARGLTVAHVSMPAVLRDARPLTAREVVA
jgi:two-component system sensor histidine kinase YesM